MADGKNRFKIGNTTINLGEIEKICKFNTEPMDFCRVYLTPDPCRFHLTPPNTCHVYLTPNTCRLYLSPMPCGGYTPPIDCDFTQLPWDHITPQLELEDIVGLKEQLIEDLKVLEEHEMALRKLETPQTMEEIDAIEDKLVNSLAEVQKLKEEFTGKKQK